jgi:glutamine amidotransferase
MCQLLGMNANTPTDVMFSFTGLATRATEHKDGFGIAFFEDRGVRLFVDPHSALQSPVAEMVRTYPIRSDNVIAHIRKATQGRIALENTHPFMRELWGRYWVFAHNGDLKDYAPRLHGAFRPVGSTDSERAFCWLMQELAKAHASVPTVQPAAVQRAGPVGARHHPPVLAGAATSLPRRPPGRRGPERRLRRPDAALRPRGHHCDRAAHARRGVDGLRAR